MFDAQKPHDSTDAFRLLVSRYHPDTLRYPAGAVITPGERLRHALTWNVFKTLEQIAPSAWMRPLVARCTGLPDGYDSAPHTARVTCWSTLEPAPSAMLRRGRRHGVPVAAIVDTDDTVLTFMTPAPADLVGRVLSETAEDGLLDLAEATAWFAGSRSAYVSVVLPFESAEATWASRVRRRADRVRRVLNASGRGPSTLRGIGVTTWGALHEMLAELGESRFISNDEQGFALMTAGWMSKQLGARASRQRLA